MPANLQPILAELQKRGVLPREISPAQMNALRRAIQRYSDYLSQDGIKKAVDKITEGLKDIMNPQQVNGVTTGATEGSLRGQLSTLVERYSTVEGIGQAINWDFIINTATSIMGGAGRYIADTAPEQMALYPGWALSRFAERETPRGFRVGAKGALIPVPDDDWPARWAEAGALTGYDFSWEPWDGDAQTGRGVALKSSGIWQALGDLRDDSLGNPYPPFAFNSGFKCGNVSRAECIELGLIDPGDEVNPPEFNLDKLINVPLAKAA
jgi:hypothetical protein